MPQKQISGGHATGPGAAQAQFNGKHLHDEWKQGVCPAHNQVAREVAHAMGLLCLSGQYDISNERDHGADHNMIATIPGLVTMPCLGPDHDPAHQVYSNGKPLRIDRTISESFDDLWKMGFKYYF